MKKPKPITLRVLVADEARLRHAINAIAGREMPFLVTCSEPRDMRTLAQNALQHVWYVEIEKQGKQMRAFEVRRECKLRIGVPILLGDKEDDTFRERWERLVAPRFNYIEQIELMELLPVTSLMDSTQMRTYLDTMVQVYAAQGIVLEGLAPATYQQYPEAAA